MSRSKHAVELSALLVDEIYGELTSRIFTILLRRGRLQLQQLSRQTRLSPRQLQHGLVVLVQQGLVYYNTEADSKATYYEANHDAAYGLVRSGKIIEAVESRYGSAAKDVIQNLFLLGHTKVSDLEKVYDSKAKSHVNGNGTANGSNEHGKVSGGQLHAVLIRLLQARVIQPVTSAMFRSPTDTYEMVEREILKNSYGGSTKGVKQKEELKIKVRSKLQELRSEGQDWHPKGKKRPPNGTQSNGVNGAHKRRRLSDGGTSVNGNHQYEDDGQRLDPDLILRINYEKCVVALRNQRLVALANDRIGETTSLIYAQGLKLIEEKIERCRPDPKVDDIEELGQAEGPTFTTMELAATLSKSINAAKGIGKENEPDDNPPGGSHRGKRRRAEVDVDISDEDEVVAATNGNKHVPADNDDLDSLKDDPHADEDIKPTKRPRVTFQEQLIAPAAYDDGENRLLQVKKHLQILEADECKFIRRAGSRGQGEWGVDFDAIIHYMQEAELDTMILENYGKSGHRLARMMRKLGKLDEKQLPTLALMKQKDIRTKLAEMQMAGVVDIQEVPRDAGRTTARTIFLWYFDTERVSAILLDGIYKSMSRCYQRLDVEKRRSHDILTLTERSDIRDLAPEQYLEPAQVNSLAEIRDREQSILGQIHRLDEMVGIFRDY